MKFNVSLRIIHNHGEHPGTGEMIYGTQNVTVETEADSGLAAMKAAKAKAEKANPGALVSVHGAVSLPVEDEPKKRKPKAVVEEAEVGALDG